MIFSGHFSARRPAQQLPAQQPPAQRPSALKRPALRLAGAIFAFALSAGLVACDSGSAKTPIVSTNGTFTLTVKYSGVSGPQPVRLTDASGTARTFNMQSGAGIADLKGIYTVDMPGHNASAQTVDLTAASQTVTFSF